MSPLVTLTCFRNFSNILHICISSPNGHKVCCPYARAPAKRFLYTRNMDETPTEPTLDVLAPWGNTPLPPEGAWGEDVLGDDYAARTLPLLDDDEGPVFATLVHYKGPLRAARPRAKCLYLHGRNDYFFQTELAERCARFGVDFYALDLRKYGRSLRPWQTIGYAADLSVYEEELGLAVEIMHGHTPGLPLFIMGHSTGGLLATLWAYRRPGAISGLILNSAWLELQSMAAWRPALQQIVGRIADRNPRATVVGNAKPDVYGPSITEGWFASGLPLPNYLRGKPNDPAAAGWNVFPEWKRHPSYPVPAGWFQAVLEAQSFVANEVHLDCPVLSFASTGSAPANEWSPEVFSHDIVLDADAIAERSAHLSDTVTIARLPGKHDLTLSDPPVRERFYTILSAWFEAALSLEDTTGRD